MREPQKKPLTLGAYRGIGWNLADASHTKVAGAAVEPRCSEAHEQSHANEIVDSR